VENASMRLRVLVDSSFVLTPSFAGDSAQHDLFSFYRRTRKLTSNPMESGDRIEIHLQNGFRDDPVDVVVDGVLRARTTATTRFQVGLADILSVHVRRGSIVEIRLPAIGKTERVQIQPDRPYVVVQKEGGDLRVDVTSDEQRYA